ncbi:MAG: orotidine-5'-phosphate decarboxylase [Patescibacteria group bacterium]
MAQTFERLKAHNESGRYLCVGLDPDPAHVAKVYKRTHPSLVEGTDLETYCHSIFRETRPFAATYKAQYACWAKHPEALRSLFREMRHDPSIPRILDGKFGDIGNSMKYWADFALYVGADAVTVSPYMGVTDVTEELVKAGVDVFVLASTSNEGSKDIQQQPLRASVNVDELVAQMIQHSAKVLGPMYGMVVGATRPEDMGRMLASAPGIPVLSPGVGAQGGDVEAVVGLLSRHDAPWTINVSRGIAEALKSPQGDEHWLREVRAAAQGYASQFRDLAAT